MRATVDYSLVQHQREETALGDSSLLWLKRVPILFQSRRQTRLFWWGAAEQAGRKIVDRASVAGGARQAAKHLGRPPLAPRLQ
ncbi:hypothetical protein RRG08_041468 [Elysia crispata]|uniref:Uncharacterized protein n=1 Tax=Elysia crispata TaxID=231223 RepID=A0AAE1CRL5_9GAST|nr:hypothetical protein RRG08_041468 [Elysia crispata]